MSTTTISPAPLDNEPGGTRHFTTGALFRRELIAVIVVTALALALCLIALGSRSLWLDEFYSAFVARSSRESVWRAITSDGGNFMGYYALLHVWVLAFGWTPFALRLPSAIAEVALVPVVFFLGRRAGGPRVGLIACLLTAVSAPLVVWAQQARGYSIAVLAVSSTWLLLIRLQSLPTRRRYMIFCIVAIVATYFLLTASLVIAAGLIWLYLASPPGKAKSKVIVSAVVYILGCLPLVLILQSQGVSEKAKASVGWVAGPSWASARSLISEISSGSVPDFFPPRLGNAVLTAIVLLCWGVALLLILRRGAGKPVDKNPTAEIATSFLFWLVIPIVLAWIISIVTGDSIFGTSFLLPIVPGGLLLAAYGLANIRWQLASLAATLALVGLSLAVLVPTYGVSNENWKAAAAFVLITASPGDCVAFDAPSGVREFAYYVNEMHRDDAYPRPIFPRETWAEALASSVPYSAQKDYTPSAFFDARRECERVWMVINRSRVDFGYAEGEVAYALGPRYYEARHYNFTGITVNLILKR